MPEAHRHVDVYYHRHRHPHLTHYGDSGGFTVSHDEEHPHGLVSVHEHGKHGDKTPHSHKKKFELFDVGGDHHDPASHEWEKDAPEVESEPQKALYTTEEESNDEEDGPCKTDTETT